MIIELGVGARKRFEDSIGVDINPSPVTDVVMEATEYLRSLPPASVDMIISNHFLCQVQNYPDIIVLAHGVLVEGGTLTTTVPHFSSPYALQDPLNIRVFGVHTPSYFSSKSYFSRQVPNYYNLDFEVTKLMVRFKDAIEHPVGNILRRSIGFFIRPSIYPFWESYLSSIFWAYELEFTLTKRENGG